MAPSDFAGGLTGAGVEVAGFGYVDGDGDGDVGLGGWVRVRHGEW